MSRSSASERPSVWRSSRFVLTLSGGANGKSVPSKISFAVTSFSRDENTAAGDDVGAPCFQSKCETGEVRAAAERGEGTVALFPAVAVRAMKNRSAVACLEPRDRRQVVDHAGRDQQYVSLALSTSEASTGVYCFDVVQLYQLSVNGVRSLWRGRCTGVEASV